MSENTKSENLRDLPHFWQLWLNPIFHRYRRSRIRLSSLITGMLVYGGTSAFFYALALGFTLYQTKLTFPETAVYPFGFLVLLQIFILNFVGTGEVAAGMARESIDDTLTYQRLTPLSPATKIIGYLLGLPVRQFYHFLVTLPVTVIVIRTGNIPMEVWGPIYIVLFTSTVMFYTLAMSVGFIMGKRFSALISQGLVILLYVALPQLSNFGFVIFEYLTIRPAVFSALQVMTGKELVHSSYALFYNWEISHTVYCIVLQGLISLIFYSVLLRRWRNEGAHLLSKLQAVTVTCLLHVIILGGIWANTSNGSIFDIEIETRTPELVILQQTLSDNIELIAATVLSLYGLIGFTSAVLLQYIYTPDKFRYLAGLRERYQRSKPAYAITIDSASGIPTSIIITFITTFAWLIYCDHMLESEVIKTFIGEASATPIKLMLVSVSVIPLLAHAFTLELLGRKLTSIIAAFVWILPIAGALLFSAWDYGAQASSFLYGFSPLTMDFSPGYILASLQNGIDHSEFVTGCKFGLTLYLFIAVYSLALVIIRHRKYMKMREITQ